MAPRRKYGYNPTLSTGREIKDLLPGILARIGRKVQQEGVLVIQAWPTVIGEKIAPMARAVSFNNGVLFVKVANSTLHSLLTQHEKPRLIASLRKRVPQALIKNIVFRIG